MEATDEGDTETRGPARAVSVKMQTAYDPAISSYYVNDGLYRKLVEDFTDWQREELVVTAPELRDHFRLLIEREARLLDEDLRDANTLRIADLHDACLHGGS